MKKFFLILIVFLVFVSLYSCGDDTATDDVVEQNVETFAGYIPEFVFSSSSYQIPDSRFGFTILVDKNTGVQYALITCGYNGYGILLVDSEGKPILYDGD